MRLSKIFIILSVSASLLLVPKKFALACGFWVLPGEYRFWLLQPDLTNQKDLTPFFFASTYLYKGDINSAVENYEDINTIEWHDAIKRKASRKDIDSLLNYQKPEVFFVHENEIASHNSFLTFLHKPENREFYQYFLLSKKIEQAAANPDPWEEGPLAQADINSLIGEAEHMYKRSNSAFIKLRTAFQLVKLYGYNQQAHKVSEVYDNRIAPAKIKSWIKTAALYKKAIHTEGYKGDYLLSKVFDKGGYNRSQCLMRIRTKDMDSIMMHAKSQHEKTVIRAMQVFNYPGRSLAQIRRIYQAEPGYTDLSFLLLREINKVEDWLVTTKLTDFELPATGPGNFWLYSDIDDSKIDPRLNYREDKIYARQLYEFLLRLISEGKQKNIALLRLYASHLALVNADHEAATFHLSQITNEKALPLNVRTQIKINRFLLDLEKGLTKSTEDKFVDIVKQSPEKLGVYDAAIMKDQLILYTGRKLINQGDKAKGLMLLGQTNRALGQLPISTYKNVYQEIEETATPAIYDQIITVLKKKNKTAFERLVADNPMGRPWSYYYDDESPIRLEINKMLDGKASWYIRSHELSKAIEVLQQIPDSFWKKEPYSFYVGGDPFYLNVNHAHKIAKEEKLNLNKKQVVEQMIRLEKIAKESPQQAALCYFKLANAWYNMTWYGKNWLMVKQWWSIDERYGMGEYKQTSFAMDYYGCKKAKEYYLLALQATKDKDLAKLSCFMAGKCEVNLQRYQYSLRHPDTEWDESSNSTNPYRKKLRQKGINVKEYDDLVRECALYVEFIKKYNWIL